MKQTKELFDGIYAELVRGIAAARLLSEERVNQLIATGKWVLMFDWYVYVCVRFAWGSF